ncbi:MAG: PepSY-associated TM helix domain-containing protein [Bacteroidota bacterium]
MKKLKGLGNRTYNVLFHTHTVAGIVISFALFVIFYAGAYSIFRHQIEEWEHPDMRQPVVADFDIDAGLQKIDNVYGLNYHEITNIYPPHEGTPVFMVYGAYNDTDSTTARMGAYLSPQDGSIKDTKEPITTVGDTIYFLHYFRQIPTIGLYISGLVALFFLFAIVTGILIHWRNLLTKFYAFLREGKWKLIWTNAHTVLGVIGLPFQIVYAITGAFFGLLSLILLPTVFLLYDGDTQKVFNKVNPASALTVSEEAPDYEHLSINQLYANVQVQYPGYHIHRIAVQNYGKEDALATWNIDDERGINASGTLVMRLKDGKILEDYSILPNEKSYAYSVIDYISKLHFASFGGMLIKVLYFILAMITCFMIISGVLIWREARNNKRYTFKQRLFHHRVTKAYLAICLSMFPAFAIIFIANKIVPMELVGRASIVNGIFFSSWLGLTILGLFWNKYAQQNRNYLIIGGMLALLVPLANGITTGAWVWNSWTTYPSVAYVDIFWMMAGLTALYLSFFVLKVKTESDKPNLEEEQKAEALKQQKRAAKQAKPTPQTVEEAVVRS